MSCSVQLGVFKLKQVIRINYKLVTVSNHVSDWKSMKILTDY